ncbi:MAG: efflux RND transporter periplasmic adaptor subunit [Deltaproteobacteria bacterium]|nr:efflux RND transporter periplasmic adaptor subunit [Deltaproteobacteria bacterium]MBW2393780.1 efflux RND transporter periplasmic adaptor subunit [Deltaproteobacteria bacterium]
MPRTLRQIGPKALAPVIVICAGVLATTGLIAIEPRKDPLEIAERLQTVAVMIARAEPVQLHVRAQGTVEPRLETDLVVEVSGRIVWIAPTLEAGGVFTADEPLLRIDARDFETALERARAGVERAVSEHRLARATEARRKTLHDVGATSPAALEEAESRAGVAAAGLREARAALAQAELELERTEVRAPFDGRVRSRAVAVGMFASRGTAAARVYSSEALEVRLPIPSDDLAFLDLGVPDTAEAPRVGLTGKFAGRTQRWQGRLVRMEGALDARTRMLVAVARVDLDPSGAESPLPVGLFVEAEIEGRKVPSAFNLPRAALRGADQVLVIDAASSKVHLRHVEVLRAIGDRILVSEGLEDGEQVATRALAVLVEGMEVRPQPSRTEPGS